ncbi:MAG: nucleotide sugar dehydrogenase [Vulcanimicrobiaceae bacterium]
MESALPFGAATIVGLGYIGLPTAALLAETGLRVVGYDIDAARVATLRGGSFGSESEVARVAAAAVASGRLVFANDLQPSDAFLICVPTPTRAHRPDLHAVVAATIAVAEVLRPGDLVVLESTVPPGTMERVVAETLRRVGLDPDDYRLAHCPERVIPGAIVHELHTNARVIGGRRPGDAARARDLYRRFVRADIHLTDCTTAELVKVVENTFRDVNIAFANELALLCDELDVDVWETIELANQHPRVAILSPGPGVGGHCIPVDPHFLSNANPFVTELIQTARRVNERMPDVMVRRLCTSLPIRNGPLDVTLLGASYKANVDDTRESPTERIDELLRERGYRVRIYDPIARGFVRPLEASLEAAVAGTDAVMILTEHDAFAAIDPTYVRSLVRTPLLFCGRPRLDLARWRDAGFTVSLLGTPDRVRPAEFVR